MTDAAMLYNHAPNNPNFWGRIMAGNEDVTDQFWESRDAAGKVIKNGRPHDYGPVINSQQYSDPARVWHPGLTTNDFNGLFWRQAWEQLFLDPRNRDLYQDCGYPDAISPVMYQAMFDREGLGQRVVRCLPEECWQLPCSIYEDED